MTTFVQRATIAGAVVLAAALAATLACGGGNITVEDASTLTVVGSGTGNGRITSSDNKINCKVTNGLASGTCTGDYAKNKVVSLSATPDADQEFKTWGGPCSGATACSVTITEDATVSATFVSAVVTQSLELQTPVNDDGAAIIRIDGPSVLGITAASGLDVAVRPTGTTPVTSRTIIVRGNLTSGLIARVNVRGINAGSTDYHATVLSVAGRQSAGYVQRQNLGSYTATVKP